MVNGTEMGMKAFHMNEEAQEKFKKAGLEKVVAKAEENKAKCNQNIATNQQLLDELNRDKSSHGMVHSEMLRTHLVFGCIDLILMLAALAGEWVFIQWTVSYFGLGKVETYLVTITFLIVALKSIDYLMSALRQQFPAREGTINLVFAEIAVLCVIVSIFCFVAIRENLFEITAVLENDSLEALDSNARTFSQQNDHTFLVLMAVLAFAVTFIGGMSYHGVKNRLGFAFPQWRRSRRVEQLRRDIDRYHEITIEQDANVAGFEFDFETGIEAENRRHQKVEARRNMGASVVNHISFWLAMPLFLLIFGFLLFWILSGKAHAAEDYIIAIDTSKSTVMKNHIGQDHFAQNIDAVETFIRQIPNPGDSLRILGITGESFSRPYEIINCSFTSRKGRFGELLAREKLKLLKDWKELSVKPEANFTDILGALLLSAIYFEGSQNGKHLIIYSDMRQSAHGIDLEKPARLDGQKYLEQISKAQFIPDLSGVEVSCLGVHSAGKTPAYWMDLRRFWAEYFKKSGAVFKAYTMERRYANEQGQTR